MSQPQEVKTGHTHPALELLTPAPADCGGTHSFVRGKGAGRDRVGKQTPAPASRKDRQHAMFLMKQLLLLAVAADTWKLAMGWELFI